MAGTSPLKMDSALVGAGVAIQGFKRQLAERLDASSLLNSMWSRLDPEEQERIDSCSDSNGQCLAFIEILQNKPLDMVEDFLKYMERNNPDLLTNLLFSMLSDSNTQHSGTPSNTPNRKQSLQLSLELALKERDSCLRDKVEAVEERDQLLVKLEQLRLERDRAIESLNGQLAEKSLDQSEMNGRGGDTDMLDLPEKLGLIESEVIDTGTDKVIWETHRVTLQRVQNYGFGIAISGGRDNLHFSNGDPSIAVSDVLKAGPAENKLQVNDRVISVNGRSMENVEHAEAITMLKESGPTAELVIKRKILVPDPLSAQPTKITLQKRNKKDDYGIVLGCKFYVKHISDNSLSAFDGGIKEGDTILKINNINVESLSLHDAQRQLEKSREKLQLTLKKPPRASSVTNLLHKRQNSDLDYTKFQPYKPDNMYLPATQHEKPDYEKPTIKSFVQSNDQLQSHYKVPVVHPTQSVPPPSSPYRIPDQSMINSLHTGPRTRVDLSPQPPLYESRDYLGMDSRYISYGKEGGGAGLRIAGGNHTGIFIAGVQDGSPAQREGLMEGDEIIKIDGQAAHGMTREEAVLRIMSLEDQVNLVVQYRLDEFRRDLTATGSDSGDRFYIRTHMTYEAPKGSNHMSFKPGEIFQVNDTLRAGVIGEWSVIKYNEYNEEVGRGIIPNKSRAQAIQKPRDDKEKPSRGSIFRRRSQKRSKSLSRDHWEDVIFAKEISKHPVYERVVLKEPGFRRPVIVYGGISDICRAKLLQESPDLFDTPMQSDQDNEDTEALRAGIIKLGSIRSVLDRNKHCVLDVVPSAIDKLNYAQYYPIVVNIHIDKKELVKEIRAKWSAAAAKHSKKLFEQALKIEKDYPQIFTNQVKITTQDSWFKAVRDAIAMEQTQSLWMSEQRPAENLSEDYLFPMANRLGYGVAETDMETSRTSEHYASATLDRSLSRATSDPNLVPNVLPTAPPYPNPPQYIRPPDSGYQSDHPFSIYSPPRPSTTQSHYASPSKKHHHRHHHRRDRLTSDSKVAYHSSPYGSMSSVDRRQPPISPTSSTLASSNGRMSSAMERLHQNEQDFSANSRGGHYMSPRNNGSTLQEPYKYTRMTSLPSGGSSSKSKPKPPVRSDSMNSSQTSEGLYGQHKSSSHRRLQTSVSLDPSVSHHNDQKYLSSNTRHYHDPASMHSRRSSGGHVSRQQFPHKNGHTPHRSNSSRATSSHYASPSGQTNAAITDDDEVFHATPVQPQGTPPPPTSFSNQLYMDGDQASEVSGAKQQNDNATTNAELPAPTSFESYKNLVSNRPFYGAKKSHSQNSSHTNKDSIEPSAFESYNKENTVSGYRSIQSVRQGKAGLIQPPLTVTSPEMEPTPENHTLLDSVSGVFDSAGGTLTSPSTGVSINIPANAIPPGVQQDIYFKVCQQDDSLRSALDKSKGETLLSPLVMCGPHGLKFQLPVELRLPHNAAENADSWNFSLKSSSDATDQDHWQSVNLNNMNPQSTNQNTVSVLVDHF